MRLKMTALFASALAGFLYVSVPSASALPAPSRGDVTTPAAKTGAITEEVRYAPPRLSPLGLPPLRLPSVRLLRLPSARTTMAGTADTGIPTTIVAAPALESTSASKGPRPVDEYVARPSGLAFILSG